MVTARLRDISSLRSRDTYRVVQRCLAAGALRDGFRLVEFSVQSNHLHLICEGADRAALARGLQGLFIRVAKQLNKALGRTGRVFADRYHDRILETPSQVRNALVYVLNNARKHAAQERLGVRATYAPRWVDPCSSAPRFFGTAPLTWLPEPKCWLLRSGWRRAGPVARAAIPG